MYKGQIKDKENVSDNVVSSNNPSFPQRRESTPAESAKVLSGTFAKGQSMESPMGKTISDSKRTPEKDSRREMILSLVKEKGETSIKDITAHFPNCGEKTIQRELAVLVSTNVLKKTGEKRWSQYFLG